MQITVSGKNLDVSKALRERVESKLSKLSARYDNLVSANVTLSTERRDHIVQVTLFGKGSEYRAESSSDDMYRSISEVVDKLDKQISKSNERPLAIRKKDVVTNEGERVVIEETVAVAETPKANPNVIKTVTFTAESLTVAEAVKALEEKGHSFYTFFNSENERINVVYTTDRGVCLIDPKLP